MWLGTLTMRWTLGLTWLLVWSVQAGVVPISQLSWLQVGAKYCKQNFANRDLVHVIYIVCESTGKTGGLLTTCNSDVDTNFCKPGFLFSHSHRLRRKKIPQLKYVLRTIHKCGKFALDILTCLSWQIKCFRYGAKQTGTKGLCTLLQFNIDLSGSPVLLEGDFPTHVKYQLSSNKW